MDRQPLALVATAVKVIRIAGPCATMAQKLGVAGSGYAASARMDAGEATPKGAAASNAKGAAP